MGTGEEAWEGRKISLETLLEGSRSCGVSSCSYEQCFNNHLLQKSLFTKARE